MLYYLFIILGLLFFIEATTSTCRKCGYIIDKPESGLVLQSSLGLLSRVLVFMFTPVIGAASDGGRLLENNYDIIIPYLIIILFVFMSVLFRDRVLTVYMSLISRMTQYGSLFVRLKKDDVWKYEVKRTKKRMYSKYPFLYFIALISYVPYYLSWPVIMILLGEFNESRGLILGLSSVLNGLNTILLTAIVDPKLVQLGKAKRVICVVYDDLLSIRFVASIVSLVMMILIIGGITML